MFTAFLICCPSCFVNDRSWHHEIHSRDDDSLIWNMSSRRTNMWRRWALNMSSHPHAFVHTDRTSHLFFKFFCQVWDHYSEFLLQESQESLHTGGQGCTFLKMYQTVAILTNITIAILFMILINCSVLPVINYSMFWVNMCTLIMETVVVWDHLALLPDQQYSTNKPIEHCSWPWYWNYTKKWSLTIHAKTNKDMHVITLRGYVCFYHKLK